MNQKAYYDLVARIGCLICGRPAELHHCRKGVGMGQRGEEVIPLCAIHHRLGSFGEAIHNGYKTFSLIHGSEEDLIKRRDAILKTLE